MMLIADKLSFSCNKKKLIHNITLELSAGEMLIVVGPNGAGKSTLVKLLAGYLNSTSGQCILLKRAIQQWSHSELSHIRTVMKQHSILNASFSVRDIVGMGRAPHGKRFYDDAISDAMRLTECDNLAKRDYSTLSGGEQQRVQLARAIAQLWQPQPQSKIVFLDEPTSALDLYHQQHTLRLLKQLAIEKDYAIFCILHDLNLAALYADRIILLHQGEIACQGSPNDVLTKQNIQKWYHVDSEIYPHPNKNEVPQIFLNR